MAEANSVPTLNYAPNPDTPAQQSTTKPRPIRIKPADRRYFIGGSDARVIMGNDESALLRLWREKRGEVLGRICRSVPQHPASLPGP